MAEKVVQIIILDVDDRIRRRLVARAKRRNMTVNEAAGTILAERFGLEPYQSKYQRFRPPTSESTQMVFRVPESVRQALREQAAHNGATMGGIAKVILAEGLGLKPPSPLRRERGKR